MREKGDLIQWYKIKDHIEILFWYASPIIKATIGMKKEKLYK